MTTETPAPLWGYKEVAEYLGCSQRYVGALVRQGEIPSTKIGRIRRFRPHDVEQWVAQTAGTP